MVTFNKILCPVDFSTSSRYAFQYANMFAEKFNAELTLLHVAPNITDAYVALLPDFPSLCSYEEDDLMYRFNEFTGDWKGNLLKIIRTGKPYVEILGYAEEHNFDLLVMGAKSHSGFERLFLGTTGEKVIRNADLPVLSVQHEPKGPPRKILVPTDFSPLASTVLPLVAAIADRFKAEVNLLHVVELGQRQDAKQQAREFEYFKSIKEKLAAQWEVPQQFGEIETNKWIRHHRGTAGYGIVEFAQDQDIDFISMATHGRSGFQKMLIGSVTEKVARITPCPFLSFRSPVVP